MRKYLLSALLALATFVASAQPEVGGWSIIPRVGVSIANLTGNKLPTNVDGSASIGSKFKPGMAAGLDVEHMFTNHLAASLGVYYSMQGYKYPDYVLTDVTTYIGYNARHANMQYINIPLMVSYYITGGLAVKAGLQLGFLLDAKEEYNSGSATKNEDDTFTYEKSTSYEVKTTDLFKKADISIPIGLSYEYENVVLDARYNIGLTKVYRTFDEAAANELAGGGYTITPSSKTSNIVITVGYRFNL